MYRHVLIATDGSALAEHAVSRGLSLAKSLGAQVTAVIVEAPFNVFDVRESRIRQMSEAYAVPRPGFETSGWAYSGGQL
jgi:nucleotide-binding universal stress UspA family protein